MKGDYTMDNITLVDFVIPCVFSLVALWLLVTVITALTNPDDLLK